MIRKFVKPAQAGASIPDPARGRDLPQDGQPVAWNAHWARLERRGDIEVTDPPEPPVSEAAPKNEASTAPDVEPAPEEAAAEG